jgi:hypothetical protein
VRIDDMLAVQAASPGADGDLRTPVLRNRWPELARVLRCAGCVLSGRMFDTAFGGWSLGPAAGAHGLPATHRRTSDRSCQRPLPALP